MKFLFYLCPTPNMQNNYKKSVIMGTRHPFFYLSTPFPVSSGAPDQSHNQVPTGRYLLYFMSTPKLLWLITKQHVHRQYEDRFPS